MNLLLIATALAADPHLSHTRLVTANGYGVAVFNGDDSSKAVLNRFSDHLYQQYDASSAPTWNLLFDTYFGLNAEGYCGWLTSEGGYGYLDGSNVMWVDRTRGNLKITEYIWSPMELDHPAFAHLLSVENTGSSTVENVRISSLHNYHIGDDNFGTDNANEEIGWSDGLVEQGTNTGFVINIDPLVAADSYGCEGVYDKVNSCEVLNSTCNGSGTDMVGGMQWMLGDIAAGNEAWVGVVQGFANDTATLPALVKTWQGGRQPEELLNAELDWWAAWLQQGTSPADLTADEQLVYNQALVFLKMGQVREEGDAAGQILASLPINAPADGFGHLWNITWVRDSAYAIRGLTEAGFYDEAEAALRFFVQPGKSGDYAGDTYLYGVDDYALSVCRVYGDGSEWSDDDGTGPNVEFDNFGLYLWALGEYTHSAGDDLLTSELDWNGTMSTFGEVIFDGVADVLTALVDDNDLIKSDSSIWERHWNGHQQQFTYTSAWAVSGLRQAAKMATTMGDSRAATYDEAADRIAAAMAEHLVDDDGVLVSSLEQLNGGEGILDLAAVDAFNGGALAADGEVASASFAAWMEGLAVESGHGFARNDDSTGQYSYDAQEWVMVDLRLAEALRRACRVEEAQAIEGWITDQAIANHLIIPELMTPDNGDYAGPAPMMGFGSGLYVLTLHNRVAVECSDDTDADTNPDTDTESPSPTNGRCGCGIQDNSGVALVILPVLALLWRRQRQRHVL